MARKKSGLTFYQKEKRISNEKMKETGDGLFLAVVAILLACVLVYSLGLRTSIVGASMEPELTNGQEVLIDRIIYNFINPRKGDVVVFKPNGNENAHYYVKRVVGVPGDTVRIENGVLILNGETMEDLFSERIEDAGVAKEEIVLAEDEYFLMGDNCNNSEDSRSANIGNVNKEAIVGKAWFHMASERKGLGRIK